jgi:hypothetical protein
MRIMMMYCGYPPPGLKVHNVLGSPNVHLKRFRTRVLCTFVSTKQWGGVESVLFDIVATLFKQNPNKNSIRSNERTIV